MWQQTPPKPPQETEQTLIELAAYYRQLISYHNQAAAMASSKLTQVETLLSSHHANIDRNPPINNPWAYQDSTNSISTNPPELIAEIEDPMKSLPSVELPRKEDLSRILQEIIKENQGKMLRLDYLSLEVGERLIVPPYHQPQLKIQLKQLLTKGEDLGLWASIPDSPDCWTLDLADFPELTSTNSHKRKKAQSSGSSKNKSHNRTRLPYCEKVEQYQTLTATIRKCLSLNYPKPIDANGILAWMYPEGLEPKQKAKAYQSVSDGLNKGCIRNHWDRVQVGFYRLKEPLTDAEEGEETNP